MWLAGSDIKYLISLCWTTLDIYLDHNTVYNYIQKNFLYP